MTKDYLTSPFNDEYLHQMREIEDRITNSPAARMVAQRQKIMETWTPVAYPAIAPDILKSTLTIKTNIERMMNPIDIKTLIGPTIPINIIPTQTLKMSELTKNLTRVLDSLKTDIAFKNFTHQIELSKLITSIQEINSNFDIDSYQSIKENQKVRSEKYEVNSTVDTYAEKNYDSVVQENNDIKILGILLGKFITSYQKIKNISSHTYTLASNNKIALTVYANSFTLLVEYMANLTNPLFISLALSIITTVVIHSTNTNKRD